MGSWMNPTVRTTKTPLEVRGVSPRKLCFNLDEHTGRLMPDRSWDTSVWVSDSRAIRAALGWVPRRGLEDGFRRLVDWLRDDPARLQFYEARQPPAR